MTDYNKYIMSTGTHYISNSGGAASGSDPSGHGLFVRRTASGRAISTWNITEVGNDEPHNNVQPYIVYNTWRRTA